MLSLSLLTSLKAGIIFPFSAFLLSATFLLLCGYVGESKPLAVTFLTLAVGAVGLSQAGHIINQIDIAPRFAGMLMGITNTAGTLPGIIGPQIAKRIAQEVSIFAVYTNADS